MKSLYIVSSPHGGSTLLSLVVGKHPDAANLGELSFVPKLLSMDEKCTCQHSLRTCPAWSTVFDKIEAEKGIDVRRFPYDFYLGDAIKANSGSGLVDWQYQTKGRILAAKFRGAIDTAFLLTAPRTFRGRVGTLFSRIQSGLDNTITFYECAAAAWRKNLLIDASKLPRKAPQLYLRDPDSVRVLHLARDGRGVVASRRNYMSVEYAARRWRHYHRLSLQLLAKWVKAEHRMFLRYEDFVTAPEKTLRKICTWLDMDYSPEMLDFEEPGDIHSAGGNPARFAISGGIRAADEKWRTILTKEDLATFEAIAGNLNREFGYQ